MRPETSVIIPSLRGGRALVGLVERLREDAPRRTELLIADNGVPAETAKALSSLARIVPMGANRGFAAAVNGTVAQASGELLVIVNDDIAPVEGFLAELIAPLYGSAEMVAGVLLQGERPQLIESAGIEIDVVLGPHDYLHGEPVGRLEEAVPPPLGPCGGAAAYRRESFARAGGFDEGFFAYCEDVDLAIRLRASGARCAIAPRARGLHTGSGTLGYRSLEKARLVGYGRGYLLRKYGVLRDPLLGTAAVGIELAASLGLAARHRSLQPALERVRGWQACRARSARPPASLATVGLAAGLRRRRARSRRFRKAESGLALP